jgi:hypothetical protein
MKKELIYRDEKRIEEVTRKHQQCITYINASVEAIKKLGVELTDEMLPNILYNDSAILAEADRQVQAEHCVTSKFGFLNKRVDTTELQDEISEIIRKMKIPLQSGSIEFHSSYIDFKDGKARLSLDFDNQMNSLYAVFLDSPAKEKAWKMANEIAEKINELEDFLQANSNGHLHAIDRQKFDGGALIVLPFKSVTELSYHVEVVPMDLRRVN